MDTRYNGTMPDAATPAPTSDRRFRASFGRWARRVRGELVLGRVLTGAALGLLVGAAVAAGAWKTRHGALRPWAAGAGVVGAIAGYAVARRKRWDDGSVALYLDSKLGSNEAIATACGAATDDASDPGRAVVLAHASSALDGATAKKVRPPIWHAVHGVLPVAAAAIVWVSLAPLPPSPPKPPPPPGSEPVQVAELKGLEKIIALEQIDARDEAQKERLKKLADDAKKLREKLKTGMEKREAQADIAKLRDGITAERLSLGEGEQRQGLESAMGKLGENPAMKDAQKALGDRDLTQFDQEMQKLANKLEKEDRAKAMKSLEDAAEAAKKGGAKDVAKALEEQKKLLEERGKQGDALKELAKALGDGLSPDAKKQLEDFNRSGDPKDEKKLAKNLDDALKKLTPEERKRLAENLKKRAEQMGDDPPKGPSKQELRDLAKELDSPEGQAQLEDELKKMAQEPGPESEESERQKALDDAQGGAGEAEKQLGGGVPMPVAGGEPGPTGGKGDDKDGDGKAQPGHTEGGGSGGDHKGMTGVVDAPGVRAKADSRVSKGAPMPGVVMGRTTGRVGETANTQGQGALGVVGPGEVGGIERSEVPEEYREQVGRYFQPK